MYGSHALKVSAVERETFEEENFRKFRGFVAIHESFLCEIWGRGILWHGKSEQFAKVFSLEKFPTNGILGGHHIVYCRCALIELTTHVLHDHTHARTQLQALRQEQLRYQEEMAEKNKVRQKGQHQGCDKPTQWMFTIVFLPVPPPGYQVTTTEDSRHEENAEQGTG